MPYRQRKTVCVVHLVRLRLTEEQAAACERLRREAGRCWSDLVRYHHSARTMGEWPSVRDLEIQGPAGGYALHSQTIQAIAQQLDANLATTTRLRQEEVARTGSAHSRYPYHTPDYQTPRWKSQAIRLRDGQLHLSNGRTAAPLVLSLPECYHDRDIRQVALLWRGDGYELALTLDTGLLLPPLLETGQVAGVDVGEIHLAALTTEQGATLIITGRALRSETRRRNKKLGRLSAKQASKQKGSRRWRKLQRRKAQERAKSQRRQRDICHKASRQAVQFAQAKEVRELAVGDMQDSQQGVALGRRTNQKLSQWPRGQFERYLEEKARRVGIHLRRIPEDYSTRTCCCCGQLATSTPRGRNFTCTGCGVRLHRDANGAANICSRALTGQYGRVQPRSITYRRPILYRRRSAADTRHVARQG